MMRIIGGACTCTLKYILNKLTFKAHPSSPLFAVHAFARVGSASPPLSPIADVRNANDSMN